MHGIVRDARPTRDTPNLDAVRDALTLPRRRPARARARCGAIVAASAPGRDLPPRRAGLRAATPGRALARHDAGRSPTVTARADRRRPRPRPGGARRASPTSREIFGAGRAEPAARGHARASPSSPYGVAKLAAHQLVGLRARARRAAPLLGDPLQPRVAAAPPAASSRARSRAAAAAISLGRQQRAGARRHSTRCATGRRRADIVRGLRADGGGRGARRLRARERRRPHRRASSSTSPSPASASTPERHVRVDPGARAPARAPSPRSATRRRARERLGWSAADELRGADRARWSTPTSRTLGVTRASLGDRDLCAR